MQDFIQLCTKVIGIGKSYTYNWPNNEPPNPLPQPLLFIKPPTSLIGEGNSIEVPEGSSVAHEDGVEIALIIGKEGKDLLASEAEGHIAGYALALDMCAKDVQQAAQNQGYPWAICKGMDTFAPIGAFIEKSRVPDPLNVGLELRVSHSTVPAIIAEVDEINGELRQEGSTSDLIYSPAQLVAYASGIFTLKPGDVILTGTPAGVGLVDVGDKLHAVMRSSHGEVIEELSVDVRQRSRGFRSDVHWLECL